MLHVETDRYQGHKDRSYKDQSHKDQGHKDQDQPSTSSKERKQESKEQVKYTFNSKPKVNEVSSAKASILLPVVRLKIEDTTTRALLDSGSTASFCNKKLADHKGQYIKDISLELAIFGAETRQLVSQVVMLTLVTESGSQFKHEFIVLEDLGINQDPPSCTLPAVVELKKNHGIQVSDISSKANPGIDILLGSDVLNMVIRDEKVHLNNGTMAVNTIFGWVIQGPISGRHTNPASVTYATATANPTLEDKVNAFMELEQVPTTISSKMDTELLLFSHHITYDEANQRYEVPLLWKEERTPTPNKKHVQYL